MGVQSGPRGRAFAPPSFAASGRGGPGHADLNVLPPLSRTVCPRDVTDRVSAGLIGFVLAETAPPRPRRRYGRPRERAHGARPTWRPYARQSYASEREPIPRPAASSPHETPLLAPHSGNRPPPGSVSRASLAPPRFPSPTRPPISSPTRRPFRHAFQRPPLCDPPPRGAQGARPAACSSKPACFTNKTTHAAPRIFANTWRSTGAKIISRAPSWICSSAWA